MRSLTGFYRPQFGMINRNHPLVKLAEQVDPTARSPQGQF